MELHIGSEQGRQRPMVVLQNETGNKYLPTLSIAALIYRVDKKRHLPPPSAPGLKVPSVVQLEQIFIIDKRRAQRFAGQASEEEMNQIEMGIKVSLGLDLLSSK